MKTGQGPLAWAFHESAYICKAEPLAVLQTYTFGSLAHAGSVGMACKGCLRCPVRLVATAALCAHSGCHLAQECDPTVLLSFAALHRHCHIVVRGQCMSLSGHISENDSQVAFRYGWNVTVVLPVHITCLV